MLVALAELRAYGKPMPNHAMPINSIPLLALRSEAA